MKYLLRLLHEQQGAVTLYLILIIVPIFFFCALLIDFSRVKVAEKEAENAVKTAVRSVLSAFSPQLRNYGLYALVQEKDRTEAMFVKTIQGNMSGTIPNQHFQFIDHRLEPNGTSITAMYTLANHTIFKKQILEEMKYRAPMIYSLELADKFKKTGLSSTMGQAVQYSKNAAAVEKLLDERDEQLDKAWDEWKSIHQKASAVHPFYKTQLADLNQLSGKVGIHTVDEVGQSLKNAKDQLKSLEEQIKGIDGSIQSLAKAGAGAADAIRSLSETKSELSSQMNDILAIINDLNQLLEDVIHYTELLLLLKLRSTNDLSFLKNNLAEFDKALNSAKSANDRLNAELRSIDSSNSGSPSYAANQSFQSIQLLSREELDQYGGQAATAVALFSGLQAQLSNIWIFDAQNYENANNSMESFWQKTNDLFTKQSSKEAARNQFKTAVATSKREQRNKAQPALDLITKAMGSCSIFGGSNDYKEFYTALQGDPAKGGSGYYQSYMNLNHKSDLAQPVPNFNFENADKAGESAMSLISSFESLLTDVRDEFYIDEYAISKFNYRTSGLEKDISGNIKHSKESSRPESHPLSNQELEYLLYGANSCLGNYSLAYGEMFAFRLAVGTAESLLEPQIQALNVGSPLLVLLAAVAEGAVKAQVDMVKLVQGEAVPLAKKLGSLVTLTYKDYLRIFFLMHSRDSVMLSRLQSLIQLNTGTDLQESTTYVSGTGTTSIRLWFIPRLIQILGSANLYPCQVSGSRCEITKTGVMAY